MADSKKEEKAKEEAKAGNRLFKYMGTAHVRRIEKGDTFGGQYPDGVEQDLEWNLDSKTPHVINSADYPKIGDEVWDLLNESDDFEEVTGARRIPVGAAEEMWKGMGPNINSVPGGVAGEAGSVGGGGGTPAASTGTGVTPGTGTGVTGGASNT